MGDSGLVPHDEAYNHHQVLRLKSPDQDHYRVLDVRHFDTNGVSNTYPLPSSVSSVGVVVLQSFQLYRATAAAPGRGTASNKTPQSTEIHTSLSASWRCGIPQTAFHRCYLAKPACVSCHKSSLFLTAYCTQSFKRRRMRREKPICRAKLHYMGLDPPVADFLLVILS